MKRRRHVASIGNMDLPCAPRASVMVPPSLQVSCARCTPPSWTKSRGAEKDLSATGSQQQDIKTLEPGTIITVQDTRIELSRALGKGSFGTVWSAFADGRGEVAVKDIMCRSQHALTEAISEIEFLRNLRRHRGRQNNEAAVPVLISADVFPTADGVDGWRILLVMTRVRGEQLDKVLARRVKSCATDRQAQLEQFAAAAEFAKDLLTQISTTFEETVCPAHILHRDATARNILVDLREGGHRHFSLVDFGLAVSSKHRRGSKAEWRKIGVAGDGRYWPTSNWRVFELESASKLEDDHSAFCEENNHHLDLHSVGITAIQALVEMSPACEDLTRDDDAILLAVRSLRNAWERYWSDVSRFWRGIFDAIAQQGGALQRLRTTYGQARVHIRVQQGIAELRGAINVLRTALVLDVDIEADDESAHVRAGLPLMEALLLMVSAADDVYKGTSWKTVQKLLEDPTSVTDEQLPVGFGLQSSSVAAAEAHQFAPERVSRATTPQQAPEERKSQNPWQLSQRLSLVKLQPLTPRGAVVDALTPSTSSAVSPATAGSSSASSSALPTLPPPRCTTALRAKGQGMRHCVSTGALPRRCGGGPSSSSVLRLPVAN